MSSETIYKCDKCGVKKQPNELIRVEVKMNIGHGLKAEGYKSVYVSLKEVCMSCAEKFGMIKKIVQEEEVKAVAPISSQQKLYEIVSEIIWENQQ